jgi:hypothetical protein
MRFLAIPVALILGDRATRSASNAKASSNSRHAQCARAQPLPIAVDGYCQPVDGDFDGRPSA